MPRSLSRSVVGVSQSQTWKASSRCRPARSICALQLRVPPDVVQVDGDAERAASVGIEPVADVERLLQRVDAGPVGGVHRVQRLDRQRHPAFAGVGQQCSDPLGDLFASAGDVLVRGPARQRAGQAADDEDQAGGVQLAGLVEGAPVVVAHRLAGGGIGVGEHAAATVARELEAVARALPSQWPPGPPPAPGRARARSRGCHARRRRRGSAAAASPRRAACAPWRC